MKSVAAWIVVSGLAASTVAGVHVYPSSSSTVVGSVGFISPNEVGYFWSSVRGDSVQQTLSDPLGAVNQLKLDIRVPTNSLASGNRVDWAVELNGTEVGMFTVTSGQTGLISETFDFPDIVGGGSYTLRMEVRNLVPGGGGSHTFAAVERTTATLLPSPGSAAVLGLGTLMFGRRRRT